MTIQEAIKSGKRFRRKEWGDDFYYCDVYLYDAGKNLVTPTKEELLADDWEIEDKTVWTMDEIDKAFNQTKAWTIHPDIWAFNQFFESFKKELLK